MQLFSLIYITFIYNIFINICCTRLLDLTDPVSDERTYMYSVFCRLWLQPVL